MGQDEFPPLCTTTTYQQEGRVHPALRSCLALIPPLAGEVRPQGRRKEIHPEGHSVLPIEFSNRPLNSCPTKRKSPAKGGGLCTKCLSRASLEPYGSGQARPLQFSFFLGRSDLKLRLRRSGFHLLQLILEQFKPSVCEIITSCGIM